MPIEDLVQLTEDLHKVQYDYGQVGKNISLANLSDKIDLIWTYLMRRAEADLHHRNLEIITEEILGWYSHIADELRKFYKKSDKNLSDKDFCLEIERVFGKRILDEICIPHGLTSGACILLAASIAKGVSTEDLKVSITDTKVEVK